MVRPVARKTRTLWACRICGRKFAKQNQSHSCRALSIADHFRGRDPQLRTLFESLCRALSLTGPLRVDAVPSSINLISGHHFGAVVVRRDHLRVGFLADHAIRSDRISGIEKVGPHRVGHHVSVRSVQDLDRQLLGWLSAAQAMQAHSGQGPDAAEQ